jgi:hypothetical protein
MEKKSVNKLTFDIRINNSDISEQTILSKENLKKQDNKKTCYFF